MSTNPRSSQRKESTKGIDDPSPCGTCEEIITKSDDGLWCELCTNWFHPTCQDVNKTTYQFIVSQSKKKNNQFHWFCLQCNGSAVRTLKLVNGLKERQDAMEEKLKVLDDKVQVLSDKVDANQPQEVPDLQDKISEEVREAMERRGRRLNVVMRNIPEKGEADDAKYVNDLFYGPMALENIDITCLERLGERRRNQSRLLKVSLSTWTMKKKILAAAKKLANEGDEYKEIYISPDLTKKEQEMDRELREQLKQRREQGEKNLYIHKGKVKERTPQPEKPNQVEQEEMEGAAAAVTPQ